jgi:hypothetical protein
VEVGVHEEQVIVLVRDDLQGDVIGELAGVDGRGAAERCHKQSGQEPRPLHFEFLCWQSRGKPRKGPSSQEMNWTETAAGDRESLRGQCLDAFQAGGLNQYR